VPDALTYDEFTAMAERLDVDRDVWEELYPMVRDLLGLADGLGQLMPEFHGEIPVDALVDKPGASQ
jgi:hypothetical protein